MCGNSRGLAGCIDTGVVVVAGLTGLDGRIDDAVIEDATKTEGSRAMTHRAVNVGLRMAH